MKTILKVLLVVLIMWPVYAQSQEPAPAPLKASQNPQGYSKAKEQTAEKNHDIPNKGKSKVSRGINTSKAKDKKENGADNHDNKTPRDWWIIIPTVVIAIFTVVQGTSMIFQYKAMRQQAQMLRRSVDAAYEAAYATKLAALAAQKSADSLPSIERAYVFVKIEPLRHVQDGSSVTVNASVMMKNYGRTPAMLNNIYGVITLRDARVHEALEIQIPPGFILGTDIDETNPCPYQVSTHLRDAEWQSIEMEKIPAYCCGVIKYEDIFHVAHETGFCWEYSSTGHKWFISGKYKDLNYHT